MKKRQKKKNRKKCQSIAVDISEGFGFLTIEEASSLIMTALMPYKTVTASEVGEMMKQSVANIVKEQPNEKTPEKEE